MNEVWIVKWTGGEIIAVASSEEKAYQAIDIFRSLGNEGAPIIQRWNVDNWER